MSSVVQALASIKKRLVAATIFNALLNGTLIALILAPVFILFGLQWFYALVPAFPYTIYLAFVHAKKVRLAQAEERLPELEWQLRTTEDTLGVENEVVESLHQRVANKINDLHSRYLMDSKKVVHKVGGIAILLILTIVLSVFQVKLIDATNPESVTGLFSKVDGVKDSFIVAADKIKTTFSDRDLYGDEKVADLGNEELNLELKRDESEIDPGKDQGLHNKAFKQQDGAAIPWAVADASYNEDISDEDKAIVKSYFEKLTGDES